MSLLVYRLVHAPVIWPFPQIRAKAGFDSQAESTFLILSSVIHSMPPDLIEKQLCMYICTEYCFGPTSEAANYINRSMQSLQLCLGEIVILEFHMWSILFTWQLKEIRHSFNQNVQTQDDPSHTVHRSLLTCPYPPLHVFEEALRSEDWFCVRWMSRWLHNGKQVRIMKGLKKEVGAYFGWISIRNQLLCSFEKTLLL